VAAPQYANCLDVSQFIKMPSHIFGHGVRRREKSYVAYLRHVI